MYLKYLKTLTILFVVSLPTFGLSQERPEGIVLPVATLGDVTETRRQILQNTLIESLSSYYRLVPQDKLEEVQEKIFQEMDYEQCTEDQCIVMIQEALQVENLFVLQVIGEGDDTQLSLKWVGLDDKKVKTDYCEDCGTKELNDRVEGLVKKLTVSEEIISTPTIEKEKVEPKEEINLDSKYSFFVLVNTVYGFGEWDSKTNYSIPYKKNNGFSFGILYKNHIFLYKSNEIEFGDKLIDPPQRLSSSYYNYKINSQYLSYNYQITNFIFGYNHLLNGSLSEDVSSLNSNNSNYTSRRDYGVEGYGISIGYLYQIKQFYIISVYDRYFLNFTESPENDPGVFYFHGLSIGGGMQF